jgi:hypothetical protein
MIIQQAVAKLGTAGGVGSSVPPPRGAGEELSMPRRRLSPASPRPTRTTQRVALKYLKESVSKSLTHSGG